MKGTVKVKEDSTYRYAGLTLDIIGLHQLHTLERDDDIYPIGSATYKLSLIGTKWEKEQEYTVIHDSELEEINVNCDLKKMLWYENQGVKAKKVLNHLLNNDGSKSIDQIFDKYHEKPIQ